MVKKTPRQVAAIKKAKENKDTSKEVAGLHSKKDFGSNQDFNDYKKLIRDGMSPKDAFKTIKLFRENQISNLVNHLKERS
jgi:hypothetical protein|tara:strand:- start:62 stop:301 length:240 start_codon:yes stop_codon:yes gene_type:complete